MQQQKWMDPTPASLLLVFTITLTLWAALTGIISMGAMPVIGFYFLTFGVLWLIGSVICFRNGDLLGGAINGVFGILLGLAPGLSFIGNTFLVAEGVKLDARADGYFLLFTGIIFLVFATCAGKRLAILSILLYLLGIGFLFIGPSIAGLATPIGLEIGGWLLFVGGILAGYSAASMIVNFSFGRPVMPLGGPLFR